MDRAQSVPSVSDAGRRRGSDDSERSPRSKFLPRSDLGGPGGFLGFWAAGVSLRIGSYANSSLTVEFCGMAD